MCLAGIYSFSIIIITYSDADSDSSDELVGGSFMEHHRRAISVQRERESIARDISARESIQREVRQSIARESVARQLQTMPEEPELKMYVSVL